MLIDTVVLVLRETLEAGVLISFLMVIALRLDVGLGWLFWALGTGFVSAVFYAASLGDIAMMFDYTGQELLDALSQLAICLCLLLVIWFLLKHHAGPALIWVLMVTVILASMREEVEIIIFYQGILHDEHLAQSAIISGIIGLVIGVSVGVLFFYALIRLHFPVFRVVMPMALSLIAAGMMLQATQSLAQVDLVPAAAPLWNTGAFLPEDSVTGQMLYAIFGYESTPTAWEAGMYLVTLVIGAGFSTFASVSGQFRVTT